MDLTPPQHTPAPGRMLHVLLPPASEAGPDPAHTAPVLGRGQGAGGQDGEGDTQQGWGHAGGQAEPSRPPPARWQSREDVHPSAARGAWSPCAVAQPTHMPDVPAMKQNKQTTITALGFPRFDSLQFNFGNLALGCSQFTATAAAAVRKPASSSARPAASCVQSYFIPIL